MNGLNQDDVKVKRKVKENILRLKIHSISFGEKNIVSQCKFGKPGLVFNQCPFRMFRTLFLGTEVCGRSQILSVKF